MPDLYEKHPELLNEDFVASFDFEDCFTVLNPDVHFDERDVALALIRSHGNLSAASRYLNRSRRSLQGFVARNQQLADLLEDLEETFLDFVEEKYRERALMKGDDSAQRFFLTTKGRNRGYGTRTEITGKDGEAFSMTVQTAREALATKLATMSKVLTPAEPSDDA